MLAIQEIGALRSLGIPPRKAQAIQEVARQTASGKLDLDALAATTDAEAVSRRLQAICGIGPWTAHHAIIRAMGMVDCLPLEDPGLRRAVAEQYGREAISPRQLVLLALAPLAKLCLLLPLEYLLGMRPTLRGSGEDRFRHSQRRTGGERLV